MLALPFVFRPCLHIFLKSNLTFPERGELRCTCAFRVGVGRAQFAPRFLAGRLLLGLLSPKCSHVKHGMLKKTGNLSSLLHPKLLRIPPRLVMH